MFFDDCKTAEDCKKKYRNLAKMYHPDNKKTGNEEIFKSLQNDFEKVFENLKNFHVSAKGEMYEKKAEYATKETAKEYMDIINHFLFYDGIEIEVIGSWIWIYGKTKPIKEELKKYHFGFSSKKASWYFHTDPYIKKTRSKYTMDDLRKMYGSTEYKAKNVLNIEEEK